MKKLFLSFLLFALLSKGSKAQTDTKLTERIAAMLKVTESKDLEKMLDYTYPKLFTLATREQMAEAMKNSFETEDFVSTFDSVKLGTVFPIFTIGKGQYAKINHTMLMRMKFKEEIDSAQSAEMMPMMEEQFGKGKVRFDKNLNTIVILLNSKMVAVKDDYAKEWSFVNYDEASPMVNMLFSKEVIEKLKEYN